jgi:hypothetical protein
MLRTLGKRRILPVANLFLYVALVGYGDLALLQNVRLTGDLAAQNSEEMRWDPVYIDRPMPLGHVLASAINYPAVLFAVPFGLLAKGWRAELIVDAAAAVYVLPLWYAVGSWIDQRKSARVKSGRVLAILRWLILTTAALTALGMVGLFGLALHRYPEAWPNTILSLPSFFWPVFLAHVAWWELRAAKKQPIAIGAD